MGKPDDIVKDKDVDKQDVKKQDNNNKKQPDTSIDLVKQQQENDNKEKIEDLLEKIEEIFESGGEAGEQTKKRYKCPICPSTFSHRRGVRPHLENLHGNVQSMDGKRKKDTKVVETKEKSKSPK